MIAEDKYPDMIYDLIEEYGPNIKKCTAMSLKS